MIEMNEQTPLHHENADLENQDTGRNEDESERKCCYVADYSEPCMWITIALGLAALIFSIFPEEQVFWLVVAAWMILAGSIATWRIRTLGAAYAIMESVERFKAENARLAKRVDELQSIEKKLLSTSRSLQQTNEGLQKTNEDLKGIIGLVGEKVGDIEATVDLLKDLYNKYKTENDRQEKNNLLRLFDLMDRNDDGKLSKEELERFKTFVKEAYGRELLHFDTDRDGQVNLDEYLETINLQVKQF